MYSSNVVVFQFEILSNTAGFALETIEHKNMILVCILKCAYLMTVRTINGLMWGLETHGLGPGLLEKN